MPQHTETYLFFTRKSEAGESYRLDFFFVTIASWATKEQVNFAFKMATIAVVEGWSLEERKVKEESFDFASSIYHSLRFSVSPWQGEKLSFSFHPADQATFNSSVLQRG